MDPGFVPRFDGASIEVLLAERDWLLALARRLLHDDGAAHDLTQDALLSVIEKPPASANSPRAFLATVLRRAAAKWSRSNRRRSAREHRAAESRRLPDTAQLAAEAEARRAVVDAVLALDEPYRRTILLRFFRGVASAVIAKEESVTPAAIDTRVFRALAMLRERLDSRFGGRARWCAPLLGTTANWAVRTPFIGSSIVGGLLVSTASKWSAVVVAFSAIAMGVLYWQFESTANRRGLEATDVLPANGVAEVAAGRSFDPQTSDVTRRDISESSAPSVGAGDTAIVTVVDDAGAPVVAARVAVETNDGIESHLTDAEGNVRIAPRSESKWVVVLADHHAPQGYDVVLTAGEHVLTLTAGSELSGVVRVAGEPPGQPLEVFLRYSSASEPGARWPVAVRAALFRFPIQLRTRCDASGRFQFFGLPEDAHGTLFADPNRTRFSRDSEGVVVDAPRSGFVLDLSLQPRAHGRVVDPFGEPVSGAKVHVVYGPSKEQSVASRIETTDAAGRFVHFLPTDSKLAEAEVWLGRIRVTDSSGRRHAAIEFDIVESAVLDVGDIVLPDAIPTPFVVRDESGAPIEGAIASGQDGMAAASGPSDREGRGIVIISGARDRVWFTAPRFEMTSVSASQGLPIEVVLRHAAEIVVRARRESGSPVDRALVSLVGRGASPFAIPFDDDHANFLERASGSLRDLVIDGGIGSMDVLVATYELRGGVLRARRLRPGVSFDVVFRDYAGIEIESRAGIVLVPGEAKEIEFVVPGASHSLAIELVSARDRSPVPDATLMIVGGSQADTVAYGTADGQAVFHDIPDPAVTILVTAPGFASSRARIERIADVAGRAFVVPLDPARAFEVLVVDLGGGVVEGLDDVWVDRVLASKDDETASHGQSIGGGRFVLENVPATGALSIGAIVGGRRYEMRHDSPTRTAKLVVPEHGSLEIELPFVVDTDFVPRLRLESTANEGTCELDFAEFDPRAASSRSVWRHVLPGRYRAEIRSASDDERGADRVLGVIDGIVEVFAHQTTRVVARKP